MRHLRVKQPNPARPIRECARVSNPGRFDGKLVVANTESDCSMNRNSTTLDASDCEN
jgi:hypothetical protein